MYEKLPDVHMGIYRDYKGDLYEVLRVAKSVNSDVPVVVYRGIAGSGETFVLSQDEFAEPVSFNGEIVPRFCRHADMI